MVTCIRAHKTAAYAATTANSSCLFALVNIITMVENDVVDITKTTEVSFALESPIVHPWNIRKTEDKSKVKILKAMDIETRFLSSLGSSRRRV